MRALIFAGAFNPLTVAHLAAAQQALREVRQTDPEVGTVVFVPSRMGYIGGEQHKDAVIPDDLRYRMLRLAAGRRTWMQVSDIELRADAQPRTYTTLCRLRDEENVQGMLLMGSDKLGELQTVWRHVDKIGREFGIVVMSRSHADTDRILDGDDYLRGLRPYIRVVDSPESIQDVSSTRVRALLSRLQEEQNGEKRRALLREIRALIPDEILPVLLSWSGENAWKTSGTAQADEAFRPEYLPDE